jgi:hypothetical protein
MNQQSSVPPPETASDYAAQAMRHVLFLAQEIGARPSTGDGERLAAEYSARVLEAAGLHNVTTEAFQSARSTYRPYLLAFGTALGSTLVHRLCPRRATSALAALAHAAATLGFAREASLQENWTRRFLPRSESRNVVGVVHAQSEAKRRVVVYGHLDSHRTPLVYSSPRWLKFFSALVSLGFASLVVGTLTHSSEIAMRPRPRQRWRRLLKVLRLAGSGVQSLAALLLLQADTTPYSAGANDNASGAATVLALAERAAKNPLQNTELWFVLTGCEEVGCYGIKAFLEAHGDELRDAYFLDFDMVGIGAPTLLTQEGLLRPMRPDSELLEIARETGVLHPTLLGGEPDGGAYTDTGMVTTHGFRGLTIDSQIAPEHPAAKYMGYWHQTNDVAENIEIECLHRTHEFGWQLLQHLDTR